MLGSRASGLCDYVSLGRGFIQERVGIGRFTDVVGPFEFDGHVLVPFVVGFDALNDSQSGEVLQKHYRSRAV